MSAAAPAASVGASVEEGAQRGARRAFGQRRLLPQARMPAWVWILIIGLCVAASLPVLQSSNATETGARLAALEAERERLRSELRTLSAHVGELASLNRIEHDARTRLRMVEATPTVRLEVDHSPPARLVPSRYLPAPTAAPPSDSPRWQALLDLLILD